MFRRLYKASFVSACMCAKSRCIDQYLGDMILILASAAGSGSRHGVISCIVVSFPCEITVVISTGDDTGWSVVASIVCSKRSFAARA